MADWTCDCGFTLNPPHAEWCVACMLGRPNPNRSTHAPLDVQLTDEQIILIDAIDAYYEGGGSVAL